jgi:hypothetical protein
MLSITKRTWQSASVTRVLAIGVAVATLAFVLLLFLVGLGDSDLPPYDPPFPGERIGWGIFCVIAWPLLLTAGIMGHDPAFVFWFPLLFVGGLFWALLVEACIVIRHGRRA